MARYIDADRLLLVLEKNFGHTGGAEVMKDLIDMQPTAEVPPVVHGKWIETSDCLATPKHYCSRCEIFAHTHLVLSLNSTAQYRIEACLDDYCPNCGARMEVQNV